MNIVPKKGLGTKNILIYVNIKIGHMQMPVEMQTYNTVLNILHMP